MATPPTFVAHAASPDWSTIAQNSKTSGSLSLTNGDLLVVCAIAPSGTEDVNHITFNTPTSTGTVTWTLRQSISTLNFTEVSVWTGAVTATTAGATVTCSTPSSGPGSSVNGNLAWGFSVQQWRSHGGVGSTAQATGSGAPSLALTTSANSGVCEFNGDWAAVSGASRTWRTVNGSAMTETDYALDTGQYAVYGGYRADAGAAGTATVGLSAPVGQTFSIVGVEVLGTGAAVATPRRMVGKRVF